jgi:hypothetical protein
VALPLAALAALLASETLAPQDAGPAAQAALAVRPRPPRAPPVLARAAGTDSRDFRSNVNAARAQALGPGTVLVAAEPRMDLDAAGARAVRPAPAVRPAAARHARAALRLRGARSARSTRLKRRCWFRERVC